MPPRERRELAKYAWTLIQACADMGEPRDKLAAAVVVLDYIDELSVRDDDSDASTERPAELQARRDREVCQLVGAQPYRRHPEPPEAEYEWNDEDSEK